MSSQVTIITAKRSRKRWAVIGFVLIVSLLIISWFTAPFVIQMLKSSFRAFGPASRTIQPLQLQLAFTLVIFLVLGSVSALIVTIFAPNKAINVRSKDLLAEREDGVKYHRKAKKRQRTLNREMREYVQSKNAAPKAKK